jgi:hypothetical protein
LFTFAKFYFGKLDVWKCPEAPIEIFEREQLVIERNFVEINFSVIYESEVFTGFQESLAALTRIKSISWMQKLKNAYQNLKFVFE